MSSETPYKWTLHDYNLYFQDVYGLYKTREETKLIKVVGVALSEPVTTTPTNEELEEELDPEPEPEPSGNSNITYLRVKSLSDDKLLKVKVEDLIFFKPEGITFDIENMGAGYISKLQADNHTKYKKGFIRSEYKLFFPISDYLGCLAPSNHDKATSKIAMIGILNRIPELLINRKREFDVNKFHAVVGKQLFGTIIDKNYWVSWDRRGLVLFFRNIPVGLFNVNNRTLRLSNPTKIQTMISEKTGYAIN
jgi:hypothetical protein